MMTVGKVENWVNILDLAHLSFTSLPKSWIIQFVKSFSATTYARTRVMYLLQAGTAVMWMWKIVKVFVHPTTTKKLIFNKNQTDPTLQEMCHPSQLQEKYGGEAEDLTVFWPPRPASDEYGVDFAKLKDKNEFDASILYDDPLVLPQQKFDTNVQKGVTHKIDYVEPQQVKLELRQSRRQQENANQLRRDSAKKKPKKSNGC